MSGFEEMVELFTALGHSPEQARAAAIGRHRNETAAREALDGVRASSNAEAAALAEHLAPSSTDLPIIDRAEAKLSATAHTYLGMPVTEANRYAKRHVERALARHADQVAAARYVVSLAEALAAVPPMKAGA